MATDFLMLGSGVNNKFYQNVSGVRLYNRADKTYLGRFTNGSGALNNGGTGLRLWGINRDFELYDGMGLAVPYKDWIFQLAYSNTPGDFTDKYLQFGIRYTYDALWARLSVLSNYAGSWPGACQIKSVVPGSNGKSDTWSLCQATGQDASSPYKQFLVGSKMSLGYVDTVFPIERCLSTVTMRPLMVYLAVCMTIMQVWITPLWMLLSLARCLWVWD